jgi:methylated-DNA-protein-cysteine methyltransferase related protein
MTFREKVYSLAKQIPPGKVATYGQLAKMAGSPGAARAVGMCMKENPDPKNIPCHRVVAGNGNLTGYAFGGITIKKQILEKEGVFFINDRANLTKSQWNPSI